MGVSSIVLLAAVVLFVHVEAFSAPTGSSTRFLRTQVDNKDYDEERAGLSVSVMEKAKAALRPNVSPAKLANWLNKGKAVDDVFARLQLNKAGDKILENPQFATWLSYVDDFAKKNPDTETSAISTLTKHFGTEALTTMVQAAKKVDGTEAIATKLEASQMQTWLSSGKSADDVFAILKLDKVDDSLLASPVFDVWNKYRKIFYQENPTKVRSLYFTLTRHYRDRDDALARIIQTAKKNGATRAEAVQLETEQIRGWKASGKTPNDVFSLLNLQNAGDNVLTSSQFAYWNSYLRLFNKEQHERASVFSILMSRYGDRGISRVVEAALKTKSSSTVAKRLQAEQFQRWMASGKSADDVFVMLRLHVDRDGEKLLDSPLLSTFTKFTNTFNKQNPDKQTTVISVLVNHYGDDRIAKILGRVPGLSKLSTDLEMALLRHWLSGKMDPSDVFKTLRLDKAGESLLSRPLFTMFTKFTDFYHAKNPSKVLSTYTIVRAYYGDDQVARMIMRAETKPSSAGAAKRMEAVLFHEWMSSPDDAFRALRLDQPDTLRPGTKLLDDPVFNFWVRFLDDFNEVFPGMTMPRTLWSNTYTSKDIVKLVENAKKNPNTRELGSKLEAEMLREFVFDGKKPEIVAKLLNVKKKSDSNWKLWEKYVQEYNKYHRLDSGTSV
ncbi:hypothetical protein V7S43_011164 [Phytophthora oleae]|uniref:RxLR effector PexRD54 WY domain-containing protein n=1 Tax=Phytophthora oleae TaxID=2107226 RepID=A0ABD3FBS7_9STRA